MPGLRSGLLPAVPSQFGPGGVVRRQVLHGTYRRSLGEAANGQPAGAARAGRFIPPGPLVRCQDTLEGRETVTESEEIIGFNLDLVAERPLVAQTRFAEDGGIGVDWRGRCWAPG